MKRARKGSCLFLLMSLYMWVVPPSAHSLVIVGGAEKIEDKGWPSGTLALVNLDSRFRYVEGPPFGGGQYAFEYTGGTADLNEALDLFSRIAVPELELVVHTGPSPVYAATADDTETVDWRFTAWVPQNFYALYRNPTNLAVLDDPSYGGDLPPPRIDVYVGGNSPIAFEDVNAPANVTVLDYRRPNGNLLKGSVYDLNSGKALHAISVMLMPTNPGVRPDPSLARGTNENGEYVLENVPDGYYQIEVRAYGYAPRHEGYFAGREHEYRETTTHLARSVDVTGMVADERGAPVEGVQLWAPRFIGLNGRPYPLPRTEPRPRATTDAQGRFKFIGVPEGDFYLSCGGDWYIDTAYALHSTSDPAIRIVVQRRGTIRITLLRESALFEGEATLDLEPVPGFGSYGGSNTATFENGMWDWSAVPAGQYFIEVSWPGISGKDNPYRKEFTLEAGGITEVTVQFPTTP